MRIILLVLLAGIAGYSQAADDIVRQVSVSGFGEAKVEADMARVHLMAQSQRLTSAEAKRDVDQSVNQVIAILEKVGLKKADLTAGQLSISPRYEYRNVPNGAGRQEFVGYFASRSIQVEIAKLDLLNPFLDAALEQKIDGINQVEYRSSREQETKTLARTLAIADSKQKAAELAAAYGVDLGTIISINYQSNTPTPVFFKQVGIAEARAFSDSAGEYIPDELSFTDNIFVVFELEDD